MTERLTTIAGSMFSGKTDELVRQIHRSEYAGRRVQAFKPAIDNRWDTSNLRSHSGSEYPATVVKNSLEILNCVKPDTHIVAIDEAQFFDPEIVGVVRYLLELDYEIIVAGLPLDFRGEPFGSMPQLLALADKIDRLTAICTYEENGHTCGQDATRTQRLINNQPANYHDPIILIGEKDSYAARCPNHHLVLDKPHAPTKGNPAASASPTDV